MYSHGKDHAMQLYKENVQTEIRMFELLQLYVHRPSRFRFFFSKKRPITFLRFFSKKMWDGGKNVENK